MEKNDLNREERRESYKSLSAIESSSFVIKHPRFTLEKDVILPNISLIHIEEALLKNNYHKKIYVDWGFESRDPVGRGIILDFYGKPGTGKTLTAEA